MQKRKLPPLFHLRARAAGNGPPFPELSICTWRLQDADAAGSYVACILFASSASCSVNFGLGVLYGQCPPLQVCDTVECCSGNAGPLLCTSTHMPQATARFDLTSAVRPRIHSRPFQHITLSTSITSIKALTYSE